ncbi:MAG: hypothetical protein WDZ50_05095 [Woeseia sp.]
MSGNKSFLAELYRRNPLLALVGWLHVLLLLATVIGALADERQVLGINTWVKPMKFMASLVIYLWTVAWFTRYVSRPRWAIKTISMVIATVIILESVCLLVQAGRGTASHFNVATDFDAVIFQTMGILIGINMLMVVAILVMFAKPAAKLSTAYLWGIRGGLLIFLAGGVLGAIMIGNNGHTFGARDGGPGLPIFNWSTTDGDLRIAHGLALHALQILPLFGFAISRQRLLSSESARLTVLAAGIFAYAWLVYLLARQALAGVPFI